MTNTITWTWNKSGKTKTISITLKCEKCYQELKSIKADDSFIPNHKCDLQWKFGKVKEI